MKRRLYGTLHNFLHHVAGTNPDDFVYTISEHSVTDILKTKYRKGLEEIARTHGLKNIEAIATVEETNNGRCVLVNISGPLKSAEGILTLREGRVTVTVFPERRAPHPDCGPPGWIRGEDKGHDVALITKPPIWQAAAKWFADLPVNVFGIAVPGATSVSVLRKYRKVLYLDDIDPCGVYRYIQWKKMVCAEWIGLTPNQLCGIPRNAAIPIDKEQFGLIKKELIPPELEEVARFLIAVGMVEIESNPVDVMEDVIRAVRRSILAKL